MNKLLAAILTFLALSGAVTSAAAPAGRIQFANGDVQIIGADDKVRLAVKGDSVNEGDTIVTGNHASAQLRMADEGVLAVRADSRIKVDTFRWDGREDGLERSVLSLVKGGFRAITGLIGRRNKSAYAVNTPTATIGIRGTDHETFFVPPPAPGETSPAPPGTYNKVNVGETFIRTQAGTVVLGVNQVGFAPAQANLPPVRLEKAPDFMRAAPVGQGRPDNRSARDAAGGDSRRAGDGRGGNPPGGDVRGGDGRAGNAAGGDASGSDGRGGQGNPPPAGQQAGAQGAGPQGPGPQGQGQGQGQGPGPQGPGPQGMQAGPPPLQLQQMPGIPIVTSGGAFDLGAQTGNLQSAPVGAAITAGSVFPVSGQLQVGSGSIFVNGSANNTIQFDAGQNPALLSDNSGFRYSRGAAPLADSGSATVNGIPVRWGVYAGGVQFDPNQGAVNASYFQFMTVPSVTPLAVLQMAGSATYSIVGGFTKPADEQGRLGGNVNALSVGITFGANPMLTSYNLNVTDAGARVWTTTLVGPQTLGSFGKGQNTPNLSVNCAGACPVAGVGDASGFVIGPTRGGVITTYSLKAGVAGVTGSVVVK